MKLKALVGAGDRIVGWALPFIVAGIAANVAWPDLFDLGWGTAGRIAGGALLVGGIPLWLWSAVQIAIAVPRGVLITRGPFALVRHPLYTSVALLVLPGCGLLADSWVGFSSGLALYVSSRLFARREEQDLRAAFPAEYPAYRKKILLPWL